MEKETLDTIINPHSLVEFKLESKVKTSLFSSFK